MVMSSNWRRQGRGLTQGKIVTVLSNLLPCILDGVLDSKETGTSHAERRFSNSWRKLMNEGVRDFFVRQVAMTGDGWLGRPQTSARRGVGHRGCSFRMNWLHVRDGYDGKYGLGTFILATSFPGPFFEVVTLADWSIRFSRLDCMV